MCWIRPIPTKVCLDCRKSFSSLAGHYYARVLKHGAEKYSRNSAYCPHCQKKLGYVYGKKIPKRNNKKAWAKLAKYVIFR